MKIVNHEIAKTHPYLSRGKVYKATYSDTKGVMWRVDIVDNEGDEISVFIDPRSELTCSHAENAAWEVVK